MAENADKLDAKANRKLGRRRGLPVLGSGLLSLSIGLAGTFATSYLSHTVWLVVAPLGLGVVNTVLGTAMLITGATDEARPE
jgi:hypothetical protein